MKSNFALSLSFDGIHLLHRTLGGWDLVGQVALDDADVSGALAHLRAAAGTLEPNGIATKLLIPNDQIKYLALDTTRTDDDDVRAALEGATPYSVDDLAYDYAKGGGRTYIAAVARETLDEAQAFATEHEFNPVSFAAVPEPFTFVGEAFFGAAGDAVAQRDAEPAVATGQSDLQIDTTAPIGADRNAHAPEAKDQADNLVVRETEAIGDTSPPEAKPEDGDLAADTTAQTDAHEDPELVAQETAPADGAAAPLDDTDADIVSDSDADREAASDPIEDGSQNTPDAPADSAAVPVFAPRLRADRSDGQPKAPTPVASTPEPAKARSEPTFGRTAPPSLAVPKGAGGGAASPLAAVRRDADGTRTAPITIDAPDTDDAPPITGDAANALPPEAASAAASLSAPLEISDQNGKSPSASAADLPAPDLPDSENLNDDAPRGPVASAMGAATAVSGAVGGAMGGIFASRRMSNGEQNPSDSANDGEKKRTTVFGARKQPKPKPKPVVGGKPRFLGLILTAILLLFLLTIAAFAALSDENIARWFGFGGQDTQLASGDVSAPPLPASAPPQTDPAAPEVAAADPAITTNDSDALDVAPALSVPPTLSVPVPPAGGQILTPEEAARIYAATGVWQRAPRVPLTPRTTSLEALILGTAPTEVPRIDATPIASVSSMSGDAVIPTPIDPPAPDTTFAFDADGQILATPEGNVTPDGILVIAGAPPLNPPTRPGTIAPEVTPQDQLAAVIPQDAAPLDDAPDGVIVIAGRPSIVPPVRTGTPPLAPLPEAEILASGEAPLVARDGLLVLAGAPPVLPPVRPGTTAPNLGTQDPVIYTEPPVVTNTPDIETAQPGTAPDGVVVIAGSPPVLPPVRPGTTAPSRTDDVETLTSDVTDALNLNAPATNTAQIPTALTLRPLPRPAAIVQAAVTAANAPLIGTLTASEAAAFRPRTRPVGIVPAPEVPEPPTQQDASAPVGLQISPEIAAAVAAAAARPNPIVNPTAQAVPVSSRPDVRPRNMDRIVERANQAQDRAAPQVASVASTTVAPSGPTGNAVARNATLDNAINLRDVNLIGIYGSNSDRRALVRLGNGRYVRVTVGDRIDGGRVTAISADALSYEKRGRALTLQVAG